MAPLVDQANRARALTDLHATLLVEAGAGTGKTSLLAGRIAILLASGVDPRCVVAITFTELAAGELRTRVDNFIARLLAGAVVLLTRSPRLAPRKPGPRSGVSHLSQPPARSSRRDIIGVRVCAWYGRESTDELEQERSLWSAGPGTSCAARGSS